MGSGILCGIRGAGDRGVPTGLRRQEDGRYKDRDAQRQVHQEDPTPSQSLGEHATEQRTEGGGRTHHRTPDTERRGTVLATEQGGHRGQGVRHDHRASDALQHTGGKQHPRTLRGGGEHRTRHEDHCTDLKHQFAPSGVAQLAKRQQQRGKHDVVERGDPLGVGQVNADIIDDGGDGDVDDRAVEHDHGQTQSHHPQRAPRRRLGRQWRRGRRIR